MAPTENFELRQFALDQRFTNPAERLILHTFVPVFVEMLGKYIANDPWANGTDSINKPYCSFQSVLNEFGIMSSILWGGIFAWDLLTIIRTFRRPLPGWTINNLCQNLQNREMFSVVSAHTVALVFALATIPFSGPRDFWCWVKDDDSSNYLNTLAFFYGWLWICMTFAIMVLLYSVSDIVRHPRDFNGVTDMRLGSIAAFSWVLVINIVVWAFASANRFWTFVYP
ncbi:hypothetical protein BC938DRAFT_475446, partial [Jimgerdemannia flammicorona]